MGFTYLVPAHLGSPGKRAVKRVCVCVVPSQPAPPYYCEWKIIDVCGNGDYGPFVTFLTLLALSLHSIC